MKFYIIIILFSLFLTRFFDATLIGKAIFLAPLLPFVFLQIFKKSIFKKSIFLFFLTLILSYISCFIFRGQSYYDTFVASVNFFFILYYFLLKQLNVSIVDMEKAFIGIILIFCLSYIIQFIIYPKVIFYGASIEYEDVRIRLAGQGFASLGYFFALNKFLKNKGSKIFNIFLMTICFSVIMLMGFRTMLAGIVIFSFVMIYKIYKINWKIILYGLLVVFLFFMLSQIPIFTEKLNLIFERHQNANFSNSDYIRIIGFEYFFKEHFQSIWEFIFGSGMPRIGDTNTQYGDYIYSLYDIGIVWADWGLLGLSWMIGPIPVIIMLIYSIRAFFLKVPNDYSYLGIWFLYLIAISFTTKEFFRDGNFVVQAMALYLVEKVHLTYNKEERI